MGGGVSSHAPGESQSANFTFVYLRMEMEKTMHQAPKPTRHKTRDNIIVIEGKRYIFNPYISKAVDLLGALTEEEFLSFVRNINEAGIKALVGLPYSLPLEKRFSLSAKGVMSEIGRLNRLLQDRNIFFELKVQPSSTYINKTTFVSTIHLALPKNTLSQTLLSGIEEITSSYGDQERSAFEDGPDCALSPSSPNLSKPTRKASELAAALRSKLKTKSTNETIGSSGGKKQSVPGKSGSSLHSLHSLQSLEKPDHHPGMINSPAPRLDDGSTSMPSPSDFDFGSHSDYDVDQCQTHMSGRGWELDQSLDDDETAEQLFHANISLLQGLVPPDTPVHVLETHLLRAEGDVDMAAQTLLAEVTGDETEEHAGVHSASAGYEQFEDDSQWESKAERNSARLREVDEEYRTRSGKAGNNTDKSNNNNNNKSSSSKNQNLDSAVSADDMDFTFDEEDAHAEEEDYDDRNKNLNKSNRKIDIDIDDDGDEFDSFTSSTKQGQKGRKS